MQDPRARATIVLARSCLNRLFLGRQTRCVLLGHPAPQRFQLFDELFGACTRIAWQTVPQAQHFMRHRHMRMHVWILQRGNQWLEWRTIAQLDERARHVAP